jgi:hypothetical protein
MQLLDRGAGGGTKFRGEPGTSALVDQQRAGPVAGCGVRQHQPQVGGLPVGVEPQDRLGVAGDLVAVRP